MKLEQGQLWQAGDTYYRIVKWARLSISYKQFTAAGPESEDSNLLHVTKKEFCRLIKGADLAGSDVPGREETAEPDPLSVPALETETVAEPAQESALD